MEKSELPGRAGRQRALTVMVGLALGVATFRSLPVPTPALQPEPVCATPSGQWASPLVLPEASCTPEGGHVPGRVQLMVGALLDLNAADVDDLAALPGVGHKLAQRMVDWRTQHGRFPDVDALDGVRGVGAKTLERLRPYLTVHNP